MNVWFVPFLRETSHPMLMLTKEEVDALYTKAQNSIEAYYSDAPADEPAPRAGMIKVLIPFCGFYDSIISDYLDRRVEMELDNVYDELHLNGNVEVMENITDPFILDMRKACDTWIEEFEKYLNRETGITIDMSFAELSCPREYNFSNDKLLCWIAKEDMKKVLDYVKNSEEMSEKLDIMVTDATRCSSGYMPYYDKEDFRPLDDECPSCFYELIFNAALPDDCIWKVSVEWEYEFEM